MLSSTHMNANLIGHWSNLGVRGERSTRSSWRTKTFTACAATLHPPPTLPSGQRRCLELFPALTSFICHAIKYSPVPRFASGLTLGFALKLHKPCCEKQMERDRWVPLVYLALNKSPISLCNTQPLTSPPKAISSGSDPSLFATKSQHPFNEL